MATIDPRALYAGIVEQVRNSKLAGFVPKDGAKFGITTGAPEEWGRLFTMLARQESGLRQAPVNPDGSLARFATTPQGERSYGPYQFNVGEYGLNDWNDVNDPQKSAGAAIRVAETWAMPTGYLSGPNNTGMSAYFGSFRRPNEVLQHSGWASKMGLGGPVQQTAAAANAVRGGSMNGGYGMSPTGVAGIAGPVQTQDKGHMPQEQAPFKDFMPAQPAQEPQVAGWGAEATPAFSPDFNEGGIAGSLVNFGNALGKMMGQAPKPPAAPVPTMRGPNPDLSMLAKVLAGRQKKGI